MLEASRTYVKIKTNESLDDVGLEDKGFINLTKRSLTIFDGQI